MYVYVMQTVYVHMYNLYCSEVCKTDRVLILACFSVYSLQQFPAPAQHVITKQYNVCNSDPFCMYTLHTLLNSPEAAFKFEYLTSSQTLHVIQSPNLLSYCQRQKKDSISY